MVFQIKWTERSIITYGKNIEYLKTGWSDAVVQKFKNEVQKRLAVLSEHPYIGVARNAKQKNIRQLVIHKRLLLIYHVKPTKDRIDLVTFWNTYQHPQKLFIQV